MIEGEAARLEGVSVRPGDVPEGSAIGSLRRDANAYDLLRRPEVGYEDVVGLERVGFPDGYRELCEEEAAQIGQQLEIQARYMGYIERQSKEIERQRRHETTLLPTDLRYADVKGLSNEVREKLERIRPESIGQASRIAGMTPAAISLLLIHLKKYRMRRAG